MPTYPISPTITVSAFLKQPQIIARALTSLTEKRFVADRIFARGTSQQVQGGAVRFQRSESIYLNRDVEETAARTEFPRAGWDEAIHTEIVRQYGLEVPINHLAVRRNQIDTVQRGLIKLGNSIVKFVDEKAMTLLTTDSAVQSTTASADWTTAGTDIIKDLNRGRKLIHDMDEGYEADTLIVHPDQEQDLLNDADIRNAWPRETRDTPLFTGMAMPMLGFTNILVTPRIASGTIVIMNSQVAGTIADEAPAPEEGYTTFQPNGGFAPIYTKVYEEPQSADSIIRGVRWPAMWLAEPKAVVVMTGC